MIRHTLTRSLYRIIGAEASTKLAHSRVGKLFYSVVSHGGNSLYPVDQGLQLRLTKDEAMFLGLYYMGQLNPYESEYIKSNVTKQDVFIDVGTFIDGWHSLLAAKMGATVVSFEPHVGYAKRFQEQVSLNKLDIQLETVALSDKTGTAAFYDAGGASSFSKQHGQAVNKWTPKKMLVTTRTLDSYNLKPTMIKIDVEGYEMDVLKGAKKTLAKYKPTLIIEVEDAFLKDAGSSEEELLRFLRLLGYKFWMFSKDGTLVECDHLKRSGLNLICKVPTKTK